MTVIVSWLSRKMGIPPSRKRINPRADPNSICKRYWSITKIVRCQRSKILVTSKAILRSISGSLTSKIKNIFTRSRLSPKDPWKYSEDRKNNFYELGPDNSFYELEYSSDNFHWNKGASLILASTLPGGSPGTSNPQFLVHLHW